MHNETRQHYNQFLERIAEINGVADATKKFSVSPQAEQKLIKKIQDSSPFLQAVNYISVDNQKGEKVGVGTNSTIAGRTNTSDGVTERKPRAIHGLSSDKYQCEQTDYDTYVTYNRLDAWRHHPEFQNLIRQTTSEQIGRDQLMIGFNGTSVADTTDRASNPLLQDVNIGWLQQLRNNKSNAVLRDMKVGTETGRDYGNLDAVVFDIVNELIEPWYRESGLVVICGRKIVSDKFFNLLNNNDKPTEIEALSKLLTKKTLGGLESIAVPFFPEDAIFVTPLSNLSIYTQNGSTRMAYFDNPRLNRVEEFRSVNESFVVEDYDACCLLEGIKFWDELTGAWK